MFKTKFFKLTNPFRGNIEQCQQLRLGFVELSTKISFHLFFKKKALTLVKLNRLWTNGMN